MIQSTDSFAIGLRTTGQAINGVRTASAYFMVDGADNMDNGANGNAVTNPSLDTIAEVKVLTASYSAEFGGRAGALINVVTKGGTREFRGSAYEFFRNHRFDARSFFDRGEPAPLKFNNPGFTIGGPVRSDDSTGPHEAVLLLQPGLEVQPSGCDQCRHVPTRRNGTAISATRRCRRRAIRPRDCLSRTGRCRPPDSPPNGRALLTAYPLPNFSGPGGNSAVTGTNETHSREEVAADRLRDVAPHAGELSLLAQRRPDLQSVPGRHPGPCPGRARGRAGRRSERADGPPNTLLNSVGVSITKNQIAAGPLNEVIARSALGLTYPEIYDSNRFGTGPDVTLTGFTAYNAGDYIRNRNLTYQVRDDVSKVAGIARAEVRRPGDLQPEGSEHASARERRGDLRDLGPQFDRQRRRRRAARQLPELHGRRRRIRNGSRGSGSTSSTRRTTGGREEPVARSGRALQRHRAALQRAEQLLDVRSGRFDPARAPQVLASDGSLVAGNRQPDQWHRHLR